jgi:hypothetical protein
VHIVGTSYPTATIQRTLAGTGNVQGVLRVFRNNTTPVVGDGAGILLALLDQGGSTKDFGAVYAVARSLSAGLEEGRLIFRTQVSGGLMEIARMTAAVVDNAAPGLALTAHQLDPNLSGFGQTSSVITVASGYGTHPVVGALELGSHTDLTTPNPQVAEIMMFRRGNSNGVLSKLVQIRGWVNGGAEDNHGGKLEILLRNANGGGAATTALALTESSATFGIPVVSSTFGSTGAATRITTSLAVPGSPANGDWWVECTGTTPSRVCAIKVQDGGATRMIASMTY